MRGELNTDENLVRAMLRRFRNVGELQNIQRISKGGELNGAHRGSPESD